MMLRLERIAIASATAAVASAPAAFAALFALGLDVPFGLLEELSP